MSKIARYWRSETAQNLRRALLRGRFGEASQWAAHGWRIFQAARTGDPAGGRMYVPGARKRAAKAKAHMYVPDDQKRVAEAKAHLKRARYLLSKWQLLAALQAANRSIGLLEANGGAHQVNAYVLELLGDLEGARAAALATFKSDPLNPKSLKLLRKHGLDEVYQAAVKDILPQVKARKWQKVAVLNARVCLLDAMAGDAALALLADAKERQVFSDMDEYLALEADTLRRMRRFEEARERYSALAEQPTRRYAALMGRAECNLELGEFDEAEADAAEAVERRLSVGPRGFCNTLFHTRFRAGRCRDAFMESRHRPFTLGLSQDISGNYVQNLDDLRGRKDVFVLADYGIGDEIRFASIYPELSSNLKNVTLSCDPRLETLFTRSFSKLRFLAVPRWREEVIVRDPATRVGLNSQRLSPHVSLQAKLAMEQADAFTSIFDLLAELRPVHEEFGKTASYLKPDRALVRQWQTKVKQGGRAGRPNIALSWRSILQDATRSVHYLSAEDLAPLAALDATFWLFQTSVDENELAILQAVLPNIRVIEGLDLMDDFEGQAAFLTVMDAAVSPCTTVGELAAALGVPTLMFGRVAAARCRLRDDGSDIWHRSMRGIVAPIGSDARETAEMIVSGLQQLPGLKIPDQKRERGLSQLERGDDVLYAPLYETVVLGR